LSNFHTASKTGFLQSLLLLSPAQIIEQYAVWKLGAPGNFHSAIGLDYDNNGQQELFQVAGGDLGAAFDNANKNNRFFVQQNNQLVDQSATLGLQYPLGRGRMPLPSFI
jgi:hypothetical protein